MHKILLLLGSTAALMLSCNEPSKEKKEETASDTATHVKAPLPASHTCYRSTIGRDTTDLSITGNDNSITGNLAYNRFEKDDNKGTITGYMKGDTLLAFYTFQSEGMTSVREVAFLKKGGALIEGFGESMEKDGRTVFKDRKTLHFDEAQALQEVECIR